MWPKQYNSSTVVSEGAGFSLGDCCWLECTQCRTVEWLHVHIQWSPLTHHELGNSISFAKFNQHSATGKDKNIVLLHCHCDMESKIILIWPKSYLQCPNIYKQCQVCPHVLQSCQQPKYYWCQCLGLEVWELAGLQAWWEQLAHCISISVLCKRLCDCVWLRVRFVRFVLLCDCVIVCKIVCVIGMWEWKSSLELPCSCRHNTNPLTMLACYARLLCLLRTQHLFTHLVSI